MWFCRIYNLSMVKLTSYLGEIGDTHFIDATEPNDANIKKSVFNDFCVARLLSVLSHLQFEYG